MADKTVSVNLRANVTQYLAAMGAAGKSTMGLGTALKTGLVAGAAVAIGASVKMAADFEASMQKIAGLVGVSQGQVDAWGDDILELSKELPQAPKELADAMFFVTSAGFRGAQAMNVLKVGAQAAAAGLGETKVVVDTLTSALNAYQGTGLTAMKVTDTMVAAVREGKMPVEDLAGSMGNVLGIAAELGISFEEVAGSIAAATRVGIDASKMVQGLQFMMTRLVDPSDEAATAMEKYGVEAGDLERMLAEEGLLATLQHLKENLPIAEFADAVGGARGLRAALALVGKNAEQVEAIMRKVGDSSGATMGALEKMAQSTTFQWDTFMSSVQALAIQFGQALLPIIKIAIQGFSALLGVVSFVGPELGTILLAFLGFKALTFLPSLLFAVALGLERVGAAGIASALGNVAGGLQGIVRTVGGIGLVIGAVALLGKKLGDLAGVTTEEDIGTLDAQLQEYASTANLTAAQIQDLGRDIDAYNKVVGDAGLNTRLSKDAILQAAAAAQQGAANMDALGEATGKAALAARELYLANLALAGGFLGILGAAQAAEDSQIALAEAQRRVNNLQANGKQGTKEYAQALRDRERAELAAVQSQLGLAVAVREYIKEAAGGEASQKRVIGLVRQFGEQAGLTKGQIRALIDDVLALIDAENKIPPKKTTKVVLIDQASAGIHQIGTALAALKDKTVTVTVNRGYGGSTYSGRDFHTGGLVMHRGGGVPAMLQPGEFVMRRSAVERLGAGNLRAMNAGNGKAPAPSGGDTFVEMNVFGENADEVADKVMRRLERLGRGI